MIHDVTDNSTSPIRRVSEYYRGISIKKTNMGYNDQLKKDRYQTDVDEEVDCHKKYDNISKLFI